MVSSLNMENKRMSDKYFLPAAVLIAGLLIAGAVLWNGSHGTNSGTTQTAAAGTAGAPSVNIKDVSTTGEPYIGNPNAPVTIAFWSDYQCPYCKAFEVGGVSGINIAPAMPDIIQNYVDTGKVKVVFKDFAFLGPDSMVDAEYARAVWALYPSQFFAWRTALYTQEPEENSMSATANLAFLRTILNSVSGINANDVIAAVAANQTTYDAAINADKTEGTTFGVNATPSFIIGTTLLAGAYPYANFQTLLNAELN
jgi:protein-disulfide isomerase